MKRLLYICNETGFFASHRLPIARAAVEHGWQVFLAAQVTSDPGELRAVGIELIDVRMSAARVSPLADLSAIGALRRIIQAVKPDLVHAITIKPVVYGGALARLAGVPLAASICGMGQPTGLLRWLVRQLLRPALGAADRTIFQNEDDRSELGRLCGGATALICGSGVDLDQFRPVDRSDRTRPVVVLAARMIEAKGVRDFVDAARMLQARGVKADFVLVGGAPDGNRGAVPAAHLGSWVARGFIQWWGYQKDMPDVWRRADIACLPSRGGEGVPRALLEAMASGLPVVTTDVPGCRDVVEDGANGYVVAPRAPADLALALKLLIANPELRGLQGQHGRMLALRSLAIEKVVAAHLEIYRGLRAKMVVRQADGDDLLLFGRS